jgi:hypothetical protein
MEDNVELIGCNSCGGNNQYRNQTQTQGQLYSQSQASSSNSTWLWILLILAALAIIGAILANRNKKRR